MSDLFLLGLTGSIGMGKTTTAEIFRDALIAVWDADAAVHELYTSDTPTIEKVFDVAPACVSGDGVDRKKISTKDRLKIQRELDHSSGKPKKKKDEDFS